MTEFKADPSKGVFDSSETKNLSEAFEKADEIINRPETPLDSEIDRDDLARHIISEALEGETQPDLLSRSAVAKMLIDRDRGVPHGTAHRVTGGGRPPPVPTDRSVRISRTTLFRR